MTDYIVSVDLGQSVDYSAVAVLHRVWWRQGERPDPDSAKLWHQIPFMSRWDLGTPYPKIVEEIYECYSLFSDTYAQFGVKLVVDAGGPGRPVIDMLRARKLRPIGVTITGGDLAHDRDDGTLTCPKRDICSSLVVAAQSGDVKVASGLECAEEFAKEVGAFGYTIRRKSGKMGYESIVEEVHDDLVVAAALGLWYSTQKLPKYFPGTKDKGPTVEDMDYNPLYPNRNGKSMVR